MLPPIHNPFIQCWFDRYCRFALRKHFYRVHLYGDVKVEPSVSTLYVSNHCSFWDPIALNYLIRYHRRQRAYCMADQIQVLKHPFFRRVGAFSVNRASPRDGMRAVRFSAELLNGPPCAVVIFPQGKAQPAEQRPIRFERGIDRILKLSPQVNVVLVALRYEFWLNQRAELLMDLSIAKDNSAAAMATQLTDRLDHLAAAGREYRVGSRILLTGRTAISGKD